MRILCKILSSNQLLYKKFHIFFLKTPFFVLTEEGKTDFDILIWDIDSVDLNSYLSEEKRGDKCMIVIMVTSYYNESFLSKKAEFIHQSKKVINMHKNIKYNDFLNEICHMIERLYT